MSAYHDTSGSFARVEAGRNQKPDGWSSSVASRVRVLGPVSRKSKQERVLAGRGSGAGVTIRQKFSGPMCDGAAARVAWFADPEIAVRAALQAAAAALLGGRDDCAGCHSPRCDRDDARACQGL
jgi:hypothetical protein